jgi:APA family basic amino acid/polyamine antiporter
VARPNPAPPPTPAEPPAPSLVRRLGPYDAAAIIVSNVIGGGILFSPPQVAASVPHPWLFLSTWLVGGLFALFGAMAYAELAALRPRAGGEYVYLRAAYGRLAAFLTGWTSFVAGFSGAVAAGAVFLTEYLGRFIPIVKDATPLAVLPLPFVPLTVSWQALVALGVIALMSWIHIRGVGPGRIVTNMLATMKIAALLVFIALGFSLGTGTVSNISQSAGSVNSSAWLLALIPVLFTYSGWNAAAYVAEEVRNPERNVPLALALGTLAVIVIYFLLNLLFLFVLPVGELANVKGSVLDVIADRMMGTRVAGDVMAAVSIISIAASISAMVFAGPRVYYAMARDGLFFRGAATVHPRYQTPAAAVIAQAIWSGLLVLSGSGNALLTYTGFSVILFAGIAVMSLFVLRRREPDAPRPFKAFGYPLAPGIVVVASLLIVLNALWSDLVTPLRTGGPWGPGAAGLIIIGLGVPVYYFFSRRADSAARPRR